MGSVRLTRHLALLAGGTALVGMATLSACGSDKTPQSPSSPAPSQSESVTPPPSASATEKAAGPSGPNSFTPTVNPKPPGAVCREVVGNVCIR